MKESIGYTATLNIAIIFIVIIFAVFAMSISYYRAYKVSNKITESIEKYEGYNYLAEEEIKEKLAVLGYNHSSVTCNETLGSCTLFSETYNVDELDEDITPVTNSSGELGYCVYTCPTDKEDYVSYKVTTNMMWNIPIIDNILNIPVETKTREIYGFGNVLSSYEPEQETPCKIVNDNNGDGIADIGDKITCGTESFYVINKEVENGKEYTRMLAEYNLNVGDSPIASYTEGIQLPNLDASSYVKVRYSELLCEWGLCNDENSPSSLGTSKVDGYLREYQNYLKQYGFQEVYARLSFRSWSINLGCNTTLQSCRGSQYPWVYSTPYWLRTKTTSTSKQIWAINATGAFMQIKDSSLRLGIRPYIKILSSDIG